VLTRLDKHPSRYEAKYWPGWRRQHLNALADGLSTPHAPAAKAKKGGKKPKSEPLGLRNEVIDVYREDGKLPQPSLV
jgi:hypothetical protein